MSAQAHPIHSDPSAASVYAELLVHASQPYARMLLEWISTGDLHDPYNEFMIKVSQQITKGRLAWDMTDDYWDRRYTVRGVEGRGLAGGADLMAPDGCVRSSATVPRSTAARRIAR